VDKLFDPHVYSYSGNKNLRVAHCFQIAYKGNYSNVFYLIRLLFHWSFSIFLQPERLAQRRVKLALLLMGFSKRSDSLASPLLLLVSTLLMSDIFIE